MVFLEILASANQAAFRSDSHVWAQIKDSYEEYHEKDAAIEFPSGNGCMHIPSYSYVINKSDCVVFIYISTQLAIQLWPHTTCIYMDLYLCTCRWLITLYSEQGRILHAQLQLLVSQLVSLWLQLYIHNCMHSYLCEM